MFKTCTKCRTDLLIENFYFHKTKLIFNSWCKECLAANERLRRAGRSLEQKKKLYRQANLKACFGLSVAQYDAMSVAQKGLCAICHTKETARTSQGETKRLAVDHDRESGRIRALLCTTCNTGLGLLCHDPILLRAGAKYLEEHNA